MAAFFHASESVSAAPSLIFCEEPGRYFFNIKRFRQPIRFGSETGEVNFSCTQLSEPSASSIAWPSAPPSRLKPSKPKPAPDDGIKAGKPVLEGASVKATVVSHGRHDKVRIFKFRRRKHSMKSAGHRQNYTELKIEAINA